MAPSPLWNDATIIAALGTVAALCNSGKVSVYTGTQPALNGSLSGTHLADATFGATAFGTPVAAAGTVTATANTITSGTILATGTAGYVALVTSGAATIMTGSVGTSAADLILNTLAFVAAATFAVTAGSLTQPQN